MNKIKLNSQQKTCIFRYNQNFKFKGVMYRSITPSYMVKDNKFQAMRAINGGKLTGEKVTFLIEDK